MKQIGVCEAKSRLSSFLDHVDQGEPIGTTRDGWPFAHMGSARGAKRSAHHVTEAIRGFPKGRRLDSGTAHESMQERRRR
jgi:antitoxin (DNA-binding transcriptional repressor) of toxin-antitoxin stability system